MIQKRFLVVYLSLTALIFLLVIPPTKAVTISEVIWQQRSCYKIEMEMGVFYWENGPGRSGFVSFVDKNGWDWIQSDYGLKPVPYRGFPNSIDRWGHPSEDNGTTYNKIIGNSSGNHVIIESEKAGSIKARLHFFETYMTIEVLWVRDFGYAFLYEGTPGGDSNSESFVLPDGTVHAPKPWCGVIDWPQDGIGEWFYLNGKKSEIRLWFAHTPAETTKSECFSGTENPAMDVFSFGRTCDDNVWTGYLKGPQHKVMVGFINDTTMTHKQISKKIKNIMKSPLKN